MASPNGLTPVIAAAVVGAACGLAGTYWLNNKVDNALAQRPPIAYIAATRATVRAAKTGQADQVKKEIERKARELAQAGYVVIDSSHLIDAPSDLRVPLDSVAQGQQRQRDRGGDGDS